MKKTGLIMMTMALILGSAFTAVSAATDSQTITAAIFPFEERGSGVKGYGSKASDIIFANLVSDPDIYLVDREDFEKTLAEHEINLSGAVNESSAIRIGQISGAKILITGSVVEADETIYCIAKIIGSETTRVLGYSEKGSIDGSIALLSENLAEQIRKIIHSRSDELIAPETKPEDLVAGLKKTLGDSKRPSLSIKISERHIGAPTIDPAAETEMLSICTQTGFDIAKKANQADIRIEGEGFSEFAMSHGNMISVKARVEMKAIDQATGKIIFADSQTSIAIDLAENIAGKKALQIASRKLAERLVPRLVVSKER